MRKTDWTIWVAFAGLFISIIGSTAILAFKIGVMNEKIMSMEKDFPQMKTDITEMQVKLDVLWRVHLSTIATSAELNADEQKALKISGVGSFIDSRYPEILSMIRTMKPDNANQAHELLISVINRYKQADEFQATRQASMLNGFDVDSLLLNASASMRERIVTDLGFGE